MEMTCWLCSSPAALVTEPREVPIGRRRVTIEDTFYRCTACGETFYLVGMGDETCRRASAAIRREDGLLEPGEIRGIRNQYGLSQAALECLIGSGEKTVVRWEGGTICQNATADTLLRVLRDHPDVVAALSAERGVRVKLPGETRSAA